MIRSRVVLGIIAALGLSGALAATAAAQPVKPSVSPPQQIIVVGIIDIGAVLRGSTAAQGLQQQIQLEQEKYQAAFEAEQREFRQAEEEIERQRGSLSDEVYADKRRAFQLRLEQAGNNARLRRSQLEQAFVAANARITQMLSTVIEELAGKSGATLVLRREAVLFQKDAIDISEAAIALLNDKLPSVAIALPSSP